MQLSKNRVNPGFKKQFFQLLCQVVADIRQPDEAMQFLKSFLTKNELDMATRRLGIAYFLEKNHTYAYIKKSLAVSSATVSSIAEQVRQSSQGVQIALEKIKTDEWAERWAQKFSKMIGIRHKKKAG